MKSRTIFLLLILVTIASFSVGFAAPSPAAVDTIQHPPTTCPYAGCWPDPQPRPFPWPDPQPKPCVAYPCGPHVPLYR